MGYQRAYNVCQTYASPYYMCNKDKVLCEDFIRSVVHESNITRCTVYYSALKSRYGSPDWQTKVCTGLSYDHTVIIFPTIAFGDHIFKDASMVV